MASPEQWSTFLADPDLVDLLELVKTSSDALDVVELSENQHSEMLAWCLTPNQGHGQSDAVLKDLLVAAYQTHSSQAFHPNSLFFKSWPPTRVMTTSFGSAFVAREHRVTNGKRGRRRLDLFVVDPGNQIVIAVEHKAGAGFGKGQLAAYKRAIGRLQKKFPKFGFLRLVLDRDLDWYSEKQRKKVEKDWTLLDYGWLSASARRARVQVARNNEAARLLMAYCERLTLDSEDSESEKSKAALAASIATRHEAAILELREVGRMSLTDFNLESLNRLEGRAFRFFRQNQALCTMLIESLGISAVSATLRKLLGTSTGYELEQERTQIYLAPRAIEDFMADTKWPLYVNVFRHARASEEAAQSKFTVRFMLFRDGFANPEMRELLEAWLHAEFDELGTRTNSKLRRFGVRRKLDASSAAVAAQRYFSLAAEALEQVSMMAGS